MLKIDLSKHAVRFLKRVPPKHRRQIAGKIAQLRFNPRPPDAKPMKSYPYLRADIGEYRIIYGIEGNTLKVYLVGKRNDAEVYRRLKRLDSTA